MKYRGFFLVLALTVLICGSGVLRAPGALCAEDKKGNPSSTGETRKTKDEKTIRRAFRMDEIEIHGDVEKPKTMFVIPRASLNYSRKDREKDFTNEILGPVSKEWVEDTERWRVDAPPP